MDWGRDGEAPLGRESADQDRRDQARMPPPPPYTPLCRDQNLHQTLAPMYSSTSYKVWISDLEILETKSLWPADS